MRGTRAYVPILGARREARLDLADRLGRGELEALAWVCLLPDVDGLEDVVERPLLNLQVLLEVLLEPDPEVRSVCVVVQGARRHQQRRALRQPRPDAPEAPRGVVDADSRVELCSNLLEPADHHLPSERPGQVQLLPRHLLLGRAE